MSLRAKAYSFLTLLVIIGVSLYFAKDYTYANGKIEARVDEKKDAEKKKADEPIPVELADAVRASISSRLNASANLRALREVEIAAQTEGVVREVLVEEGDSVRVGQVLCRLDDRELKINLELTTQQLAQAKLQHETARIQHDKALIMSANIKTDLERKERALAAGLVSEEEVIAVRYTQQEREQDARVQEAAVRQNAHRVEELDAQIAQSKLQISRTEVKAPFSGRVTERTVELGATVRNLDPLFKLGSFSPLFADVFLSEQESYRVRPGQSVEISLGAGGVEPTMGHVARISPVVDGATGTVKVTAELRPGSDSYRPGAFVRIAIETDTRQDAVVIPKQAVLEEDGERYVFVDKGNVAQRRTVELGYEENGSVEVRSGVEAGERIVVAGQGNLKDGSKTREVAG